VSGVVQGSDPGYVLGHSSDELDRLVKQAEQYEPFTTQFFRDAGIGGGMRVLDVGCGAGDVSFLARRMVGPTGRVVGVDQGPVAVATATRRARELGLDNVTFIVGDAQELKPDVSFDAVVGRLVLQFARDPSGVVRNVARHLRPGGVIAFQEVDWSGCRASPALATFSRCVDACVETIERSGADPYMGLKLYTAYAAAGLPAPDLYLHAGLGAGPDHAIYSSVARLVGTLRPRMDALGLDTDDFDVDTLASRLSREAVAAGATVIWVSLIGAAARKPG
jgi:SAM-dependent methyltransferase